jgi:hypothetical protein
MVIDRRALNRALLARQHLLRRTEMAAADALEHLVGMQAQAPNPPYVGLWTRLAGFHPNELAKLVDDRSAVRIALMRGTIHLVTARDCRRLRPLLQPMLERGFEASRGRPHLGGVDRDALAAAGRALVEERPRTFKELSALLAERWPDRDTDSLAAAVRTLVPLVQVPPRGIWGLNGPVAHTSAESWLGRPLDADPSLDDLVLRYLRAFGPASVRDMQAWSGLNGLRPVFGRLDLRVFRDDSGRELFDLPDAPRPSADEPVPVRFVPEFDNLLLSHADRNRVIADADRPLVFTGNGIIRATILVDGFVSGTWKVERSRDGATLVVQPFAPLPAAARRSLADEGAGLLAFVAPDAGTHAVEFAPPARKRAT